MCKACGMQNTKSDSDVQMSSDGNLNVNAGSFVQTKDIIIPRSSNGIIRYQNELDTSKLGQQALQYTIENGILSIKRHIEIEVIDTTAPVISGPENIKVQKGELFNPADFYSVTDFDEGLEIAN